MLETAIAAKRSARSVAWWDEVEWCDVGPGFPLVAGLVIAPDLASLMLEGNTINRAQKNTAKERYMRDMSEGRWTRNGETIIFSSSGRLLNGQNRLTACVDSGASFPSLVVFGVEESAIDDMDSGISRKASDMFSIHGEKSAFVISSAISWLWRYQRGTMMGWGTFKVPSRSECFQILKDNPGIRDACSTILAMRNVRKMGGPSAHVFLFYCMSLIDGPAAMSFYSKLDTGAELEGGNPILVLRNALTGNTQKRRITIEVLGMTAKCWNAWRTGRTIRNVRFVASGGFAEKFPNLI